MRNHSFFHGTNQEFSELLPAKQHDSRVVWPTQTDINAAYVTGDEQDAWRWAESARSRTGQGVSKVYEIEPQGRPKPDRNTDGPQFEVEGGTVLKEITMPPNSQGKLFPDEHGKRYSPLPTAEDIAYDEVRTLTIEQDDHGLQDADRMIQEMEHPRLFEFEQGRVPASEQKSAVTRRQYLTQAKRKRAEANDAELDKWRDRTQQGYELRQYYADKDDPLDEVL